MALVDRAWRKGLDQAVVPASGNAVRSVLHLDAIAALMDVAGWPASTSGRFDPDVEDPAWYWVDDTLLDQLMNEAGWSQVGAGDRDPA